MLLGFYAKPQSQSCDVFLSNQDHINNEAFFVASSQNIIDSVRWIISEVNSGNVIYVTSQSPYGEQSTDTLDYYFEWPNNIEYQVDAIIFYNNFNYEDSCIASNNFHLGPQFQAHINIDFQDGNMILQALDNSQMNTDSIYWIVSENNDNIFEGLDQGSPLTIPYDSTSNYEITCYVFHTNDNFVLAGYGDTVLNGTLSNCNLQAYYYVMDAHNGECNGMIQLNVYGGSGQYLYSWSDNSNYMDYYEMACPGTYSVTITDGTDDNCYVILNDIIVGSSDSSYQYVDTFTNVLDTCLPSFNFDSLFLGNLSFPTDTTFEINWYFVAGQDTSIFNQVYDFDTVGYYWLILGFDCNNYKAVTSYGRSVFVDPTITSNINLAASDINIYPNPVKQEANITLFSNTGEAGTIKIYDLTGKEISTRAIRINSGSNTYKLNTKSWKNGIYIIKLETQSGQTITRKVVK